MSMLLCYSVNTWSEYSECEDAVRKVLQSKQRSSESVSPEQYNW